MLLRRFPVCFVGSFDSARLKKSLVGIPSTGESIQQVNFRYICLTKGGFGLRRLGGAPESSFLSNGVYRG